MHDTSVDFDQDIEIEYRIHQRERRKEAKFKETQRARAKLAEDKAPETFNPSYAGSLYEHAWLLNYLGPFYDDQVITDVLRQVKGGKEATVYCCQAHPVTGTDLIAAKVYRPRMFRQLRNDAVYRQGRETIGEEGKEVRKRREKLAMKKKTDFGQILRHITWVSNEYETLRRLHSAGADVPRPFAQSDNAILMEFLGSEKFPAPALSQVRLAPRRAHVLFDQLLHNVELMLAHDRIHADLSAFNVLYWDEQVKIIDFPQAVDPYVNPKAEMLLARDIQRLCDYFARYGIEANADAIARDLWSRHVLHRDANR